MTQRRATPQQMSFDLAAIESRQARTDARLDAITKDIEQLTSAVGSLADIVRTNGKTPWSNIIGAVSVSFTVLAAVFGLLFSQQSSSTSRLEAALYKINDAAVHHAALPGHSVALEKTRDLERRLAVVEDWQRKNNIANTASIAEIRAAIASLREQRKQ